MKDNKLHSSNYQIKFGALISYLGIAINILSGLIYTPWMVNAIGQSDYGLYTLATSLIGIFLLDFGLSIAVSRYVAKYIADNDQDAIKNFLGIVVRLFTIIDAIICIVLFILFFLLDSIYATFTPVELDKFKIVYIIVATFSVVSFPFSTLNGIFTAYEKFVAMKIFDIFNKVFTVILMIVAILNGFGLYALVTVNAISGFITILIKLLFIKKNIPIKVNVHFWGKNVIKEILGFSIWSTLISIAQRIPFSITTAILGAVNGTASTAIFGIASIIEGYFYIFSTAINGMFLPKITKIVAAKKKDNDILPLMIKVGRFQFFIVGLISIGFICVGKEFILCWVGKDYRLAYYCTIILIIPSIISIPQQIADTTLVVLNKLKSQSYIFIGSAVVNMLSAFLLCQYFSVIGAAFSVFITYSIRLILMNFMYYKVLHINILTFYKECYLKMLAPIVISFLIGSSLNLLELPQGWFTVIMKGCIIAMFYYFFMWIMALTDDEKHMINNIFHKS